MIALVMFYNDKIRFINKLAILMLKLILKRSSDIKKVRDKGRGIPTKLLISQKAKTLRELKCVSTDCYDNVL